VSDTLLRVAGLNVSFTTNDGDVHAVKNLDFEVSAKETLGIVGESGSGKSQTMLAMMGLLADNGRAQGSSIFEGREILGLPTRELNRIRGTRISMIFQDPMTSLNPFIKIGRQMSFVLTEHQGLSRRDALQQCKQMLDAVHIPEAQRRLDMYPHELSGGMRQRVMIAAALLCRPALLIADEPTTALDVTVQAQILQLIRELKEEFDTATILITHDLGVVAGLCDRVLVMRHGVCRESGLVDQIFYQPKDEYTSELLAAVPRLDFKQPKPQETTQMPVPVKKDDRVILLQVDSLQVFFEIPGPGIFSASQTLKAVDGVSFGLIPGETLGVVGESGCGKSTLARGILRLVDVTGGRVSMLGNDLGTMDAAALQAARSDMQIIFQDPFASLNPRMTVRDIIAEPLQTHQPDLDNNTIFGKVATMLERVGLERTHMNRYPHEFSGGQCQRIGIARALIVEPRLVLCDEPVSALDVSIQGQIVALLMELQASLDLSLIFIAHDLAVVQHISHRVMVMYLGRVVEVADRHTLYANPMHPYTQALIEAVPIPDPKLERARLNRGLEGDIPSPLDPPSGCAFRTRCRYAKERCARERPQLRMLGETAVACHMAGEI